MLTVLYSLYFKYEVILDVMSIATSFVLPVVAGSGGHTRRALYMDPSLRRLLALLLAFAKRRHIGSR
jgi:4-hydroxybenzoate polyprenyltransferase